MKYLALITFFTIGLTINAQNPLLKFGEPIQLKVLFATEKLIGYDGQNTYFLTKDRNKRSLYKVNQTLNFEQKFDYKLDDIINDMTEIEYLIIEGELYLIALAERKSDKNMEIFKIKFNSNTMTFNTPEMLLDLKHKGFKYSMSNYKFFDFNQFVDFCKSDDGSMFSIIFNYPKEGNYESAIHTAFVFNNKFEKLQEFEIPEPKSNGIYKYSEIYLENNGNLLTAIHGYESYKKFYNFRTKFDYIIQNFNNQKMMFEHNINNYKYKISNAKTSYDKENIIVSGFYSNKSDKDEFPLGMAYILLDKNGKTLHESYKEFTTEYSEHMKKGILHNEGLIKIKFGEISDFLTMVNITKLSDGRTILLGEEHKEYVNSYGPKDGFSTHQFHGYKLVACVNSNGQFDWLTYIPSNMDYFEKLGKIMVHENKNKLNILFTDKSLNVDNDINKEAVRTVEKSQTVVANVEIDLINGKASRSKLMDPKNPNSEYFINHFLKQKQTFLILTEKFEKGKSYPSISSIEFK